MNDENFKKLINDIGSIITNDKEDSRLIWFLGAGFSKFVYGLDLWKELGKKVLINKHNLDPMKFQKLTLPSFLNYLIITKEEKEVKNILSTENKVKSKEFNDLIKKIISINYKRAIKVNFITTNFCESIERYFDIPNYRTLTSKSIETDNFNDFWENDNSVIYLHGTIKDETQVLTFQNYADFYDKSYPYLNKITENFNKYYKKNDKGQKIILIFGSDLTEPHLISFIMETFKTNNIYFIGHNFIHKEFIEHFNSQYMNLKYIETCKKSNYCKDIQGCSQEFFKKMNQEIDIMRTSNFSFDSENIFHNKVYENILKYPLNIKNFNNILKETESEYKYYFNIFINEEVVTKILKNNLVKIKDEKVITYLFKVINYYQKKDNRNSSLWINIIESCYSSLKTNENLFYLLDKVIKNNEIDINDYLEGKILFYRKEIFISIINKYLEWVFRTKKIKNIYLLIKWILKINWLKISYCFLFVEKLEKLNFKIQNGSIKNCIDLFFKNLNKEEIEIEIDNKKYLFIQLMNHFFELSINNIELLISKLFFKKIKKIKKINFQIFLCKNNLDQETKYILTDFLFLKYVFPLHIESLNKDQFNLKIKNNIDNFIEKIESNKEKMKNNDSYRKKINFILNYENEINGNLEINKLFKDEEEYFHRIRRSGVIYSGPYGGVNKKIEIKLINEFDNKKGDEIVEIIKNIEDGDLYSQRNEIYEALVKWFNNKIKEFNIKKLIDENWIMIFFSTLEVKNIYGDSFEHNKFLTGLINEYIEKYGFDPYKFDNWISTNIESISYFKNKIIYSWNFLDNKYLNDLEKWKNINFLKIKSLFILNNFFGILNLFKKNIYYIFGDTHNKKEYFFVIWSNIFHILNIEEKKQLLIIIIDLINERSKVIKNNYIVDKEYLRNIKILFEYFFINDQVNVFKKAGNFLFNYNFFKSEEWVFEDKDFLLIVSFINAICYYGEGTSIIVDNINHFKWRLVDQFSRLFYTENYKRTNLFYKIIFENEMYSKYLIEIKQEDLKMVFLTGIYKKFIENLTDQFKDEDVFIILKIFLGINNNKWDYSKLEFNSDIYNNIFQFLFDYLEEKIPRPFERELVKKYIDLDPCYSKWEKKEIQEIWVLKLFFLFKGNLKNCKSHLEKKYSKEKLICMIWSETSQEKNILLYIKQIIEWISEKWEGLGHKSTKI